MDSENTLDFLQYKENDITKQSVTRTFYDDDLKIKKNENYEEEIPKEKQEDELKKETRPRKTIEKLTPEFLMKERGLTLLLDFNQKIKNMNETNPTIKFRHILKMYKEWANHFYGKMYPEDFFQFIRKFSRNRRIREFINNKFNQHE